MTPHKGDTVTATQQTRMYYVGAIGVSDDITTKLYIAACDIGSKPSGDDPVILNVDVHRSKAVAEMNELRRRCDVMNGRAS